MKQKDKLEGNSTLEKRNNARLEDEPIFKRLCLRRDVVKLIFDLRMYRVILNNTETTEEFDKNHLQQFISERDCITPRIEAILAAAREGLVDVSALDTASDDLYGKLRDIEKNIRKKNRE